MFFLLQYVWKIRVPLEANSLIHYMGLKLMQATGEKRSISFLRQ